MRNLLRDRRGVSGFVTVIALTPLIGVVAVGAEAGSWYVTRQSAQNAADAAAYSGALRQACTIAVGSTTCPTDGQTVAYRGKEFAAQNGFCNTGDTAFPNFKCPTSLGSGVSQTVTISGGSSIAGPWTNASVTAPPASDTFVQAVVYQTQPAYLSKILGLSSLSIGGHAIAVVQQPTKPPCALALTGSLSFQGSANINTPNCSLVSNDKAANALSFTGGGNSVNVGSLVAAGGCTGSSTYCGASYTKTYQSAAINPFAALNSVTLPTLSNCSGSGLTAYSASTPCVNNNVNLTGNTSIALSGGVYFVSGTLTLRGNTSLAGTALFILLPGASFSMRGTGTINLTANSSVTTSQLPSALQPYASLLADMSLYYMSSTALTIGGNSAITFNGIMDAPNAAVTFQGNPTITLANGKSCGELIAASIAFNGNATFDDTGCPGGTTPSVQYVTLVQ
jgi:hypothetical protein